MRTTSDFKDKQSKFNKNVTFAYHFFEIKLLFAIKKNSQMNSDMIVELQLPESRYFF